MQWFKMPNGFTACQGKLKASKSAASNASDEESDTLLKEQGVEVKKCIETNAQPSTFVYLFCAVRTRPFCWAAVASIKPKKTPKPTLAPFRVSCSHGTDSVFFSGGLLGASGWLLLLK